MMPLDKWGVHFEVNFSQKVLKMRFNGGKSIYSDDILIIYDEYWGNIQFQSILHHKEPKKYKKVQYLRLISWQ